MRVVSPLWKVGEDFPPPPPDIVGVIVEDLLSLCYFLVKSGLYVSFDASCLGYCRATGRVVLVRYLEKEVCMARGTRFFFSSPSKHPQYLANAINGVEMTYYSIIEVLRSFFEADDPYFPDISFFKTCLDESSYESLERINAPLGSDIIVTSRMLKDFRYSIFEVDDRQSLPCLQEPPFVIRRKRVWCQDSIIPPTPEQRSYMASLLRNRHHLCGSEDEIEDVYYSVSETRARQWFTFHKHSRNFSLSRSTDTSIE
jgi:hypothetical protein